MRKLSAHSASVSYAALMAGSLYNNLVAKLVMTGDSSVGKTCIVSRYTENTMPSYLSTVGIDFKTKTVLIDETPLKLQIWDTAGQERFHTLSVSYFRGAHGFILVYDVTNSVSFENTSLWMKDIKMKAGEEVEVVLLGNKCDREDEREVSKERGEKLAWEYGIPFFETSAKENINIENAFHMLSETIYAKVICIDQSECGELERTEEKLILYELQVIESQKNYCVNATQGRVRRIPSCSIF